MVQNWRVVYRAANVTRADRILFAFSFGPFIGFWLASEAATEIGCFCLPGGGLSSGARLRAIIDHGVTVICCTPTYAIRLAEIAAEESIDLGARRVKTLIVAGEPGGSIPKTRERLQRLWPGARVFDHHGMTEVGPVTYECPARPLVLHVMECAFLAEVIDPATGEAVAPGATGELVLTTLGRIGSPLIRYRTGDLVKVATSDAPRSARHAPPCPCGRSDLALEGGILSRVDDMIVVRGVNVFPSAVEEIIRGFPEIAEYRVEICSERALTEMKIQIEAPGEAIASSKLARRLEKALLETLSLRVPITLVSPGTLPRFELKAKRWLRLGDSTSHADTNATTWNSAEVLPNQRISDPRRPGRQRSNRRMTRLKAFLKWMARARSPDLRTAGALVCRTPPRRERWNRSAVCAFVCLTWKPPVLRAEALKGTNDRARGGRRRFIPNPEFNWSSSHESRIRSARGCHRSRDTAP